MVRENPDPYLVLGVSPTATQAEITHAYRTRLRAHHPDTRHPPASQTADDDLRQVLAAYDLLRDPARRADYDRATAPPPHHHPTAHKGRHLLTVPRPAASRSPSPTEPPTPPQPMSHRHHCGPARCAGTDSCAIRAEQLGAQPESLFHSTEDRMGTDTSSALDQPTMTATTPKPPRDKVMRIATMTKQLLDEVRTQPLDTAGLERLRTIDTQIIGELLTDLTPDLRQELQRLALPLTRHTELSDTELRLAHAQLVGWLQGLLQTAQTALSDPHAVLAGRLDHRPGRHRYFHVERQPHTKSPRSTALRTLQPNQVPAR